MAHYLDPKNDLIPEINESTKEVPKDLLDNEYTREAVGYMAKAAYSKEQLEAYDKWKINVLTERGMIDDALEEGIMKGIIKGKIEGKQEIALSMLKDGMSVEIVCKYTGLSKQQILGLLPRIM